ncbi:MULTISPECIES: NADPH-dependent 7-cyano-7-deazaguanine reductase QueF [Chromohalobacter]|uniref:NADPH-dependent 7-cyano-7-deazaguanine reductase QueF n=1 Tax=Chromohalobacter TaxID=42054 RepID=UPI001FFDBA16|nr:MULTISPECIES: NADPH-dependent 7-cyano-7-deazaguanine reductase QueF [Chromohalobacter]MCK2044821.1 NADPH-dependent 7-cyano-7-deazaguanine reductase QueF [Chromohalobacter moromii]MCT8467808.1 NADPH-dependent 7-cyano-7-deazaguanine reductase QueF [Chromohalobacter canadensis]MCT8470444.1 NADPH-dependent 7-cyano-7-deazaguanine reductase QueF [Chromohalobacter canadensis]MCT8498305.1 NADPH-dependent 7-cyano-7-deazaguanine reductase QueF [Chromohalobacter canadensis]
MSERDETLEHAPLGRESAYPEQYDAGLLFPIPRQANRAPLGLDAAALPFEGEDEWHAFELSWLDAKGKPIVAVARFRLPADSPSLIESKSWKLYLNSFNQTRFDSRAAVAETLERDLAQAAGAPVTVALFGVEDDALTPRALPGECLDDLDVSIEHYTPTPELIEVGEEIVEETLHSHLLKSNCPVTGQPDWGSVLIRYRGPRLEREALLKYLISYRQHQDFHEHCVEHLFVDLMARARPEQLLVMARYVRRGGLDISPWRGTPGERPPTPLRLARQ